jgi:hypothetical protein
MRIEPVEGKTGMYRLVPAVQLEVGKYVLYFPDSLHANDIVFSASVGRQSAVLGFEVVRSNSPSPAGGGGAPPRRAGGALYVARPDGKMTVVRTTETATLRYAFGAKKTVDLNGGMSGTRINLHDNEMFLVSTPPMGWGRTGEYKVYVFEVKNGKRTSVINKTGLTFSVEPYGSAGEFVKLRIAGELVPGEYAFGPSNPTVPNNGGGGPMPVITFGVD